MSRAEADAEARKILAPINAKIATAVELPAVTLRRYVEHDYLVLMANVWKCSTSGTTEQIIKDHVLPAFGKRPIATITRKELQQHLYDKAALNLSFSVVAHIRWQLRKIFRMAMGDRLITHNPAEGLVMPRCKEGGEKRIISKNMFERLEMVLPTRERLIFRLAVYHGMRPGEIVGLQQGDIRRRHGFYQKTKLPWRHRRAKVRKI
jgi:integrase